MAVAVLKCSPNRGERYEDNVIDERPPLSPVGMRRVFVQTDNGDVLGMELDRRDNAQTVKRKLQLALKVPTDESSLTFGDVILKNDLAIVPRDSQLRLTRNTMHRSSSTPCLSPSGKTILQSNESGVIQILGQSSYFGRVDELVKQMLKAIENGVDPIPISSGLGGVYFFRNCEGESIAIVKPTDEEPYAPNNPKGLLGKSLGSSGLKGSVRIGETGYREVAAYLLDYNGFAKVPITALAKISHSVFNVNDNVNGSKLHNKGVVHKIASLQQFISHDYDASDCGTSNFPVAVVHRIGILDIRIFNTDRHAGNLLVKRRDATGRFGQVELIPIDHGLCLPEGLEDPYFEWIYWPQASIPFSNEEREYIMKLDPSHDCEMLRTELPMIREACLRVLVLCTIFLKEATAFGLCLAEIGEMMSRQYQKEPSELELLSLQEKRTILERREAVLADLELKNEQFDMDYVIDHYKCISGWKPHLELVQCVNKEENVSNVEIASVRPNPYQLFTVPELSESSKKINFVQNSNLKPKPGHVAGDSLPVSSAGELNPSTKGFVNFADLTEKEWIMFLDQFQELLVPAFANRRSLTIGRNPRLRLGTSCEF